MKPQLRMWRDEPRDAGSILSFCILMFAIGVFAIVVAP
jgi:hypothetical protein